MNLQDNVVFMDKTTGETILTTTPLEVTKVKKEGELVKVIYDDSMEIGKTTVAPKDELHFYVNDNSKSIILSTSYAELEINEDYDDFLKGIQAAEGRKVRLEFS